MKLLFAIKGLENASGGAERVFCDVASAMAERGHTTWALTWDRPNALPFYPLAPNIERLFLGLGPIDQPTTPLLFFRRLRTLRKIILAQRPDVVIGFMHSTFIPLAIALMGTGIPLVASEHSALGHYESVSHQLWFYRWVTPFIHCITALSHNIAREFPIAIQKKMVALPNPIHRLDVRGSHHPTESKILLSAGRFVPYKSHALTIQAFARIALDFPEWSLKIMGDGPLRPSLEKLIRDLGMEKRVSLPGVTKNMAQEYASAHAFALASRFESFGLVIAEAMMANLPVLGFKDAPGVNELILDQQNGLLVEGPDRVQAFADGLRQLFENPDLRQRLGKNGPPSILRRFSAPAIFDQWERLLEIVQRQEKPPLDLRIQS